MNVLKLLFVISGIVCNSLDDYNIKPECTEKIRPWVWSGKSIVSSKMPIIIRARNEYEFWKACHNWSEKHKVIFDVNKPHRCPLLENQYHSPRLISKAEGRSEVVYQLPVETKDKHQILVGLDDSWSSQFTTISLYKTVDQMFVPLESVWANGAERFVQFDFFDHDTINILGLNDIFVENDCGAAPKLGVDKDKEKCNLIGLQSINKSLKINKHCIQAVHALIELNEEDVKTYKKCFSIESTFQPKKGMRCAHSKVPDPEGGCNHHSFYVTDSEFTNCKSNSALQSLPNVSPDKVGKTILDIVEGGVSFIPYAGQTSSFIIGALRNTKQWDDAVKAVSRDVTDTDAGRELKQKVKDRLVDALKKIIKK